MSNRKATLQAAGLLCAIMAGIGLSRLAATFIGDKPDDEIPICMGTPSVTSTDTVTCDDRTVGTMQFCVVTPEGRYRWEQLASRHPLVHAEIHQEQSQ